MGVILYINGQELDTYTNEIIAQTKRINEIGRLELQEANYTNLFKVPKTATNLKALGFLTAPGNTSNIPYQKNECYLYSDTGECFVYKGWAFVKDEGKDFSIAVIDGNIDFFKAIENKNLSDLGELLDPLNHVKNVANVISSMQAAQNAFPPYTYIMADYNGQALTPDGKYGIDFVVPSANVAFIWAKIFEKYGFTYSGPVFGSEPFLNMWLTFPKGTDKEDNETVYFESDNIKYNGMVTYFTGPPTTNRYYVRYNSWTTIQNIALPQSIHMKVVETGLYRVDIKGYLDTVYMLGTGGSRRANYNVWIVKNSQNLNPLQSVKEQMIKGNVQYYDGDDNTNADVMDGSSVIELNEFDSIAILIEGTEESVNRTFRIFESTSSMSVSLTKIQQQNINFTEVFSDFGIKDFFKEILHRFSLTMYKDKYSNHIRFLTLDEVMQNGVVDWTDKYSNVLKENYEPENYAQNNYFRHTYNDKESDYNDGFIKVSNVNLPDSRDVITSKIYSPEKTRTFYLGQDRNVYKLWDKEYKEAQGNEPAETVYKPLDKRYYLMRRLSQPNIQGIVLRSEQREEQATAYVYNVENYQGLAYKDVITNHYSRISDVLDKFQLIDAELYLKDIDIIQFDFSKLYYIQQLGNYYMVNNITDYIKGRLTKVQLIRVHANALIIGSSSQPYISFDNGFEEATDSRGQKVNVWLANMYNPDIYITRLIAPGKVEAISSNQFQVSVNDKGEHRIYAEVVKKDKTQVLKSNEIILKL